MKKLKLILIIMIGFIFVSCGNNYRIDKNDLKYIPYNGDEILILKSDLNRVDTIFIKELGRFNAFYDPLSFSSDDCESYRIVTKATDPNYDRYLEGQGLASIVKSKDGETYINFGITMKGSWFYGAELSPLSLKRFDSIPISTMEIENKTYNDVKPNELVLDYLSWANNPTSCCMGKNTSLLFKGIKNTCNMCIH